MNTLTCDTSLSHTAAVQLPQTLFTIKDFAKLPEFSYLTESSLRHLLFNSRTRYAASGEKIGGNGLVESGAVIRIGRKLLIDSQKFREWTLSKREITSTM